MKSKYGVLLVRSLAGRNFHAFSAEIGAEYFPIQQLLDPYLVWTDESTGKLRSRDFFHLSNQTALLLDASCDEGTVPYSIQHDWPLPHLCCLVASLTVSTDDQVTYSVSEDPVSSQQPLSFYIFSRYWNVASSTRAEMLFACVSCLSLFIAPVIETIRVLCAYRLWQVALYQPEEVLPVLLLAQVCDFASRSMCLHLRNRSAAILLTRIAVLVDMYWGSSLLLTLDRYHGRLNMVFITVLLIDILSIWLRICALVLVRRKTIAHAPFEVALQRMYLRHPYWICLCTFGKEVSLILICLLTIWPPSAWSIFYSIDLVRIFVCLCTSTLCLSTTLSALHALAAGCTIFYY